MATLNVLYFARVREVVGTPAEALEVADDATVASAIHALVGRHPGLAVLVGSVRVALDGEFVDGATPVRDGAELVLIPPVAGGSDVDPAAPELGALPKVDLTDELLDDARAAALAASVSGPGQGAVVTFVGRVRDHARGRAVEVLEYEAYPSMARSELRKIIDQVEATWPGVSAAIHHRVGRLVVGDVAVIAAAAHAHRGPAFEACRELIEALKRDVPIWKKEIGPDGASWVSDRP
ncbi:MAG: molybdenum cofactor biosynthesis protein MoaE [Deltaproteobacteria bacterium]|nr:molybdenum cofactor biosynthesis protein MoaE [Deltaproteobacteria bacterium]